MKAPNPKFKGLSPKERKQVWFDFYCKYQTYTGSMHEFLKEHDIAASAFYRWSKKFQAKSRNILPEPPTKTNHIPELTGISAIDASIQAEIDAMPDYAQPQNESDELSEGLEALPCEDNAILASIELVLPEGYKIRLANHADVSLAIRLVQGIITHE